MFTDYARKSLLIYGLNGRYNREIKLSSNPLKLSVINENDVAVSYFRGQCIEIISIKTGKVENKIVTSGVTGLIAYQNGQMHVVINYRKIDVMNMTGNIIRSFPSPLKSAAHDLAADNHSLFFTSTKDDSLYCCDLNGSNRWNLTDDKMILPLRVTTDKDCNVYVSCYISNNVVVVSPDGKHYEELLTEKDGLKNPTMIYYDKKHDCLLVCNDGNRDAFLFDVKHSP